jgi:hypothetical protein
VRSFVLECSTGIADGFKVVQLYVCPAAMCNAVISHGESVILAHYMHAQTIDTGQ